VLDSFGLRSSETRKSFLKKTVVIAGGAGFLGSALSKRLHKDGASIICVDNLLTGDMANIQSLIGLPRFTFLRHDIIKPLTIDAPVDEIYNLACAASPPRYQIDPIHTFRTCVDGTLNLLQLAETKNARILQSSTSEVYGDPEVPLQNETYRGSVNTCGPRACYDEGKRAGETLFWEYGAHRGVETRIARIFNTYGPNMHPDDGRVVSNFIVQSLRGQPLTIYGDGSQTRSFCYVDDLIEGLIRLMASSEKMPVNLGNPGEFTMLSLAQIVQQKTGSTLPLALRPLPQDDPRQRRPDITRAKEILNWSPTIPLDQGLDRTIAWFTQKLQAEDKKAVLVS
jgi:UDP-glucuronate decarboxylase